VTKFCTYVSRTHYVCTKWCLISTTCESFVKIRSAVWPTKAAIKKMKKKQRQNITWTLAERASIKSYLLEIWYREREDGPYLRMDQKTIPQLAWPGSRDLISKFWDPLNKFWTNWAIRFKFGTEMEDGCSCVWNIKATLSGRGLGHVTQFLNFGTLITVERKAPSAWNLVQT